MTNYTDAFDTIFEQIRKDASLYYSWQSNIAAAFLYMLDRNGYKSPDAYKTANDASKSFLNTLIKKTDKRCPNKSNWRRYGG